MGPTRGSVAAVLGIRIFDSHGVATPSSMDWAFGNADESSEYFLLRCGMLSTSGDGRRQLGPRRPEVLAYAWNSENDLSTSLFVVIGCGLWLKNNPFHHQL